MKIAIPYLDGNIYGHFGHTAQFKLYTVENGTITASQVVDTNGSGHGALADFLAAAGVDELICGGIGAGAQMALAQAGIRVFGGVQGDADEAVDAFLSGCLEFDPFIRCNHHDQHTQGHSCGSHGCGGHSCGGHCH